MPPTGRDHRHAEHQRVHERDRQAFVARRQREHVERAHHPHGVGAVPEEQQPIAEPELVVAGARISSASGPCPTATKRIQRPARSARSPSAERPSSRPRLRAARRRPSRRGSWRRCRRRSLVGDAQLATHPPRSPTLLRDRTRSTPWRSASTPRVAACRDRVAHVVGHRDLHVVEAERERFARRVPRRCRGHGCARCTRAPAARRREGCAPAAGRPRRRAASGRGRRRPGAVEQPSQAPRPAQVPLAGCVERSHRDAERLELGTR